VESSHVPRIVIRKIKEEKEERGNKEEESSKFLPNISNYLPVDTASNYRRV
jgi:hypothetical protein